MFDRTSYFPASIFLPFPSNSFIQPPNFFHIQDIERKKKKPTTQKPTLESQNVIFFYPIFLLFLAFFKLFFDIWINYYLSPASIEKHWRLCRVGGFIIMKNWTIWFWRLMVGKERPIIVLSISLTDVKAGRLFSAVALMWEEKSEEKALHCLTVSLWCTPLVTQYSSWYHKLLLWKKKSTTYCQTKMKSKGK